MAPLRAVYWWGVEDGVGAGVGVGGGEEITWAQHMSIYYIPIYMYVFVDYLGQFFQYTLWVAKSGTFRPYIARKMVRWTKKQKKKQKKKKNTKKKHTHKKKKKKKKKKYKNKKQTNDGSLRLHHCYEIINTYKINVFINK